LLSSFLKPSVIYLVFPPFGEVKCGEASHTVTTSSFFEPSLLVMLAEAKD
jgi:hypothetical protein